MEPGKPQEESKKENSSSSYNKRPLGQWIAIYALVAIVIYGLVYYLFLSKKQSPYSTSTQETSVSQTSPTQKPTLTLNEGATGLEEARVTLTKSGFSPQIVTVKAGTKVTWTNQSGGAATVNSSVHPTHKDYLPLNLGEFGNGEALSLVFDKPGTYKYHNHLNASQFGTVIVE